MKAITAFATAAVVSVVHGEPVKIEKSSINIMNSETLPGNLLPNFLFQAGAIEGGSVGVKIGGGRGDPHPFIPDDTCGDDIFEGAMEDMRSPQLPYLTQDLWTCDREPTDIPVWTMETDTLKVTVTPQYAGKVWTIYDKVRGMDVLFNNRAHQPANIGALKSWASGGCEWNWSPGIVGHSAFSETQVYLTKIDTSEGPMLRVHEFDRYNGTVWQVDMIIANNSFIAHPRITNPTPVDLRGYWWTCVAVDATPSTRILTPATHVAETSRDPMRDAPWPYFAEAIENSTFKGYDNEWPTDNSYLGNHQIGDMFLRIPEEVYTPYIAHTQEDGYVLVHGHPLNGTKFFTWGDSGPGRFMQDFLAGGGKRQGDYTELQVGPAPTQMQNFPVPKHSIREWTEWFKGFDTDVNVIRGKDYDAALNVIDSWMKSDTGMRQETVHDWDAFFERYATVEPSEILVTGQPWGALEEMLLGKRLAPGLTFTFPEPDQEGYDEVQPWKELLQDGTFSKETQARLPLSYQTTDNWFTVLKKSAEVLGEDNMNWLLALHLAVNYIERGAMAEPMDLLKTSMSLRPNPIASRNMAVLQQTYENAWPYFMEGWNLLQTEWRDDPAYERLTRNMVTEISFLLQQESWFDRMAEWIKQVPDFAQNLDAFVTMRIKYMMYHEQYKEALDILGAECFPTYASARDDLMSMWNTCQEGVAAQQKGSPLTYVEKHHARVTNPIPENIGCKYASEFCANYW